MPGVVKALPFPLWEIAGVYLKIADTPLRRDGYPCRSINANCSTAWMRRISAVKNCKSVESRLQLCNSCSIVPFAFGPEFPNSDRKLWRSVIDQRANLRSPILARIVQFTDTDGVTLKSGRIMTFDAPVHCVSAGSFAGTLRTARVGVRPPVVSESSAQSRCRTW